MISKNDILNKLMKFIYAHFLGNKMSFLDSGSYIMDGIVSLNDHIIYYEILLLGIVVWMLIAVSYNNGPFALKDLTHGSILEIIWTILPGVVLIFIALPSFRLLYLMDDLLQPSMSVKIIGHQWFWSYNINDVTEFDSYLLQDLTPGALRLLDTDEHLILPSNTYIRFLMTSVDVIHSWGVPSLGIKLDAIPGRINQVGMEIYRPGLYFGACYELCGINHAFMPITLRVV